MQAKQNSSVVNRAKRLRGRAVPRNLCVEVQVFTDASVCGLLGETEVDATGEFAVDPAELVGQVWLAWRGRGHIGRSPLLQPFPTDQPIRLHVYERWTGPAMGSARYEANGQSTSGRPVVGMAVGLLEVTLKHCQMLGESRTREDGSALIRFDRDKLLNRRNPDFRVVVFDDDGTPLLESKSPRVELPGRYAKTRSLFERIGTALCAEGLPPRGDLGLTEPDIRYIAERNRLPADAVSAYAVARTLAPELKVPAEALFALAQGNATDPSAALTRAAEDDRVSIALLDRADALAQGVRAAGRQLVTTRDLGEGSLGDFLATVVADEDQRRIVADLMFEHRTVAELHGALAQRNLATPALRALLELQAITGVNVPLVEALMRQCGNERTIPDGEDLALLTTAQWRSLLADAEPEADEADGPKGNERRIRAMLLKRRAQELFPDKVFRAQVERHAAQSPWAKQIETWLDENPDAGLRTPLPVPGNDDEDTAPPALAAYKRIIDLTGDHHAVGPLLDAGLTSAAGIAGISLRELVDRFGYAFEGDLEAIEETHRRAVMKTAALSFAADYLPVGPRPSLCDCSHCRSIFGPAAYLFELLALFRRYSTASGSSLVSELDIRRPDIIRTRLSCANTNIEVPHIDLVNEILEDRLLAGTSDSVYAGLGDDVCLPDHRQSHGTSEERRAMPQNSPHPSVVASLAGAQWPWSLPYDYARDKARSARARLVERDEDVTSLLWPFQVGAGVPAADATRALARAALDLGEAEQGLITTASSTVDAWGDGVAAAVAGAGPTLTSLAAMAGIDVAALEESLDTRFVRGAEGDTLAIEPSHFCESEDPPRLTGPQDALSAVLDRLHRFERLRRRVDWSPQALDEVLQWLGSGMSDATLEEVGACVWLQRRLRLQPAEVRLLFMDPSDATPPTLRPRDVSSPFATMFGVDVTSLDPPDASLSEQQRTEAVVSQIARAANEPLSSVDTAFRSGLVAPLTEPGDLLDLSSADGQSAYLRAVSATARLSRWSRGLRLDPSEIPLLEAVAQSHALDPAALPQQRLHDAVALVFVADSVGGLPVTIAELAYLVGEDARLESTHAPSASWVGEALSDLRTALAAAREANKPLPDDPRAALRQALSRALGIEDTADGAHEAMARHAAEGLEWSTFFAPRGAALDSQLGERLPAWPGLSSGTAPDVAARELELTQVFADLPEALADWLSASPGVPIALSAADVGDVGRALEAAARARLSAPGSEDLGAIRDAVTTVLSAAGATPPTAGFEETLVDRAVAWLDETLRVSLRQRAADVVPLVEVALHQRQARRVLVQWLARRFDVTELAGETLVRHLSDPEDASQPVERAFIGAHGGASEHLSASQVTARYFAITAGTPGDRLVVERAESSLRFDWSRGAPAASLADRPFVAELQALVVERATTLVVEADGEVQLSVDDGSGPRVLLDETPGASLRRFDVPLSGSGSVVTLRVRYRTPATGGSRALALYEREGATWIEYRWPRLSEAMGRLHRAALALRGTRLSGIPRNDLPASLDRLSAGGSLTDWLPLFATDALVRRMRRRDDLPVLAAWLAGGAAARSLLSSALNLDDEELSAALELLGTADVAADPVLSPAGVEPGRLVTLLALVDRARQWRLPVSALARWHDADATEAFEQATAALRRGVELGEWLTVLAEVYDPVRANLRDAQCDLLIGRERDSASEATPLTSYEDVSARLLIDVQMSPCMTTSRIQFAYAAVQRYVEAARAQQVPWFAAGDPEEEAFAKRWVSMRQYRLHEAQMRILVHAENWIAPAIRPTKTPAFRLLEETMSSGPLSLHLAEEAMRDYAASLADVSRLEPIAIVTHDPEIRERPLAFRDLELYGTHVFARTRANPQRIYYRRRRPAPDSRWTPWELVDADLEGTHYVAAVVFGRLRLMCADFSIARRPRSADCSGEEVARAASAPGGIAFIEYEVSLSWIDREHGTWSAPQRSHRIPFVLEIEMPDAETVFDEGLPAEFGTVERDADAVLEKIGITIDLPSGMRDQSKIIASVIADGVEAALGPIDNAPAADGSGEPALSTSRSVSELPDGFDVESVSKLRLLFEPGGVLPTDYDDPRVANVRLWYVSRTGGTVARQSFPISRGFLYQRPDPSSRRQLVSTPFQFTDGQEEEPWTFFEGDAEGLTLNSHVPSVADFDVEVETVPQTVDLGGALAIQIVDIRETSFGLRLFSVPSSERQIGRMRPRFRPKAAVLDSVPETREAWGDDWVTGREFCYRYQTLDKAVAQLNVHADDTVETIPAPFTSIGDHRGVVARGQALASHVVRDTETVVYGDDEELAFPSLAYQLTVPRIGWLHSGLTPKVLDEIQRTGTQPARTLLIEKQDGMPVPDAPPVYLYIPPQIAYIPPPASGNGKTAPTFPFPALVFGGAQALSAGNASDNDGLMVISDGRIGEFEARPALAIDEDQLREQLEDAVVNLHDREGGLWRFFTFWHPQAIGFRRVLEGRGLPQLMRFENQALEAGTDLVAERRRVDYFESVFGPTRFVHTTYPRDEVDFTVTGPYSEYNWELFFDGLLYIAQRLDEEGRFEDADEIFALMVDRSTVARPGAWETAALYQTAPIRWAVARAHSGAAGVIDDDLERFREDILDQIERIRDNPYQPHLIARGWPEVYARALRLRYAEHLIEAGESDFRQAYASDNRSHLESASLRFDLAARVLGPPQALLPTALDSEVPCFAALVRGDATAPAGGVEALEPWLPSILFDGDSGAPDSAAAARRHFCTPANDALDALRARVADRLLKLRSCQDIEGVRRALSLYGRRIDPALLVRATADGMDLDVLLGRLASKKPSLYFQALWQRAMQACERARSFEDAWLGAQGQADAEALTLLQNEQEIRALEGQAEIASQRIEDARLFKEALEKTIESAEIRHEFYTSRKMLNAQEEAEGDILREAGRADARAAGDSRSASDWAWVPTAEIYADGGGGTEGPYFRGGVRGNYRLGGETAVQVYRSNAEGHRSDAAELRVQAGLMGRQGSFQRRADDWKLQEKLARKDIDKGERDLAGAEVRIAIAEIEHDVQRRRIDDARAVRTFLKHKISSQEMHAWRARRLERLRYQQHQLAYDLVSQARCALVREHGLDAQPIVPDPWDATHRGVGAAAELIHELEKQQQVYMETWQREQEKAKVYSLVERDPLAFLELLQRGESIFSVPEADFDEDSPGDYFRRLRGVTVDVPAVRGPYTNVNGRLTQLRGEKRVRAHRASDAQYYREAEEDPRFADDLTAGESIALNSGVQDDGSLKSSQGSENPPPFAMNGAVSTFRLALPIDSNHFDRQTITDVILRFGLTSRAGGDRAAQEAIAARRRWLSERPQPVMFALHSTFSTAWQRFAHDLARNGEAELVLTLEASHVPMRLQPLRRVVQSNLYFSAPHGHELEIAASAGSPPGELSRPPALQPEGVPGDPHVPAPMWRLKLRDPMTLGTEQSIPIRVVGDRRPALRRGWLICWLEADATTP